MPAKGWGSPKNSFYGKDGPAPTWNTAGAPLRTSKRTGSQQMAGNYRNSIAKWEVIIESWMRTIIRDGGVERYDHLHIDRIDSRWKDRNTWISAALNVYDLALNLRY